MGMKYFALQKAMNVNGLTEHVSIQAIYVRTRIRTALRAVGLKTSATTRIVIAIILKVFVLTQVARVNRTVLRVSHGPNVKTVDSTVSGIQILILSVKTE